MTMEPRVETFHTQFIKPSSPTPLHLRNFNLSLLAQIAPPAYIPLIFWYTGNDDLRQFLEPEETSMRLKESLSETLTLFYPFAGSWVSHCSIDCNDVGVEYVETRVNCLLHDILKRPTDEFMSKLLPIETESTEAATGRLLLVKVNFFECGGMAIGVSISHKIADLYTLSKLVNTWAAIARGSTEAAVFPEFECAPSFLRPPKDTSFTMPTIEYKIHKAPMRRLVFDASRISILKARAAHETVPQPTRVEAVAALIWKCAMAAASLPSPSVLRQVVNLRKRLNPPLPENSVGYVVSYFTVKSPPEGTETDLKGLVKQLRDGIREFSDHYVKKLQGNEAISTIFEAAKQVGNLSSRDDINFYNCLSWCRYDVYEADFGWGKPIWISTAGFEVPNVFILMDTRDGEGIEAWVWLNESEMGLFERNEELLAFASMDPSIRC